MGVINARPDAAREWAKQAGTRFPLIADPDLAIITAYGAQQSASTTVVAPGGRIVKTYPGYSAGMLAEVSATVARLSGVAVRSLELDGAPKQFASGCPFPRGD